MEKTGVTKFVKGKEYVFNGKKTQKLESDWNSDMMKWLDHTPRACLSVDSDGVWAEFVGIDGGKWQYRDYMKDFEVYEKNLVCFKPGMKVSDFVSKLFETEKSRERKKHLKSFLQCVMPEEVKSMVEEALTVVLRKEVFDEWGINDHFEKGLTNSILIYGPPGTGKTMVCESIAAILDKDLIKVDNAMLQSNVPGEVERNIKKVFDTAECTKAVVMFDECDSILGRRDSCGQIMASEINAMLTAIERYDGVVVMTTNRLPFLDAALQRRIVAKVRLDPPNEDARLQIWKNLVPKKMPLKDVDFGMLSKYKLTGGEIKNAVLLAARKAIARNESVVCHDHFLSVVGSIIESKAEFDEGQDKWSGMGVRVAGKERNKGGE